MSRSLLLTVDTKYAKDDTAAVSSTVAAPSDASAVDEIHENSIEAADDVLISSPFLGIKVILISSLQLEAILGLVLALCVALVVATVFLLLKRWRAKQHTDTQRLLMAEEVQPPDVLDVVLSSSKQQKPLSRNNVMTSRTFFCT